MKAVEEIKVEELASQSISCSSMCLSLDWDQANIEFNSNIAVGLSDGFVSVVSLREAQMQVENAWKAHGFEVWAVAYDSYRPDLLYSGADDCNFCGWDLRENSDHSIFRNTKSHRMGVCSIQKSPEWEYSVITGSYDECLRLWDMRLMERPVVQESVCLGGGVWKLKCHPSNGNLVLAACMHNGFAIVRLEKDGLKIAEEYKGHESLAYGADWFKGNVSRLKRWQAGVPGIRSNKDMLDQEEDFLQCANCEFENVEDSSMNSGQHAGKSIVTNECIIQEISIENGPSKRYYAESAYLGTGSLVATCSFYDKALHIWEPKTPVFDVDLKSGDNQVS
eukprot:Gb_35503 [translate_table: standard]